jgi:hypothetical protein
VVRTTILVGAAGLAALAGCGGSGDHRPAVRHNPDTATASATATPVSPEMVYMHRVLGDDPTPDSVTILRDGTVRVLRGGGHAGGSINDVVLSRREWHRVMRLTRRAPLHILAHNTVTPGGFGGWDNTMRYLIRRNHKSVVVEQGKIPKRIRPLVRELNGIIEHDIGRIAHVTVQANVAVTGDGK